MDRTLRVATHGTGMWKRPIERFGVAVEPGAAAADMALEAVAPNPTRGAATVAFRLAEPGAVRVALYDARGRRVATLVEGERAAGRHTVRFDADQLATGTYVVRLEAGGIARTRRVTVVR
jgi:hypothetical protein